ncbi:MAG TPA: aspartyl protease family protein [Candidatus Brocadiia bacterium]|nr:aspartyl protease family protein [Candidatus Brocadiales bacterium]
MGISYIKGAVKDISQSKERAVEFLIDSGATYTLLPLKVWKDLNLKPKREVKFILADGTKVKRKVSECFIELPQGNGFTPVILGERDDEPVLGVVTLEILGLVFNPFKRTLEPMKMLMV